MLGKLKAHWLKIILITFGVLILLAAFVIIRPDTYLPHKRIVLALPFDSRYDAKTGLIPMGETKFHPKPQVPNGHPGIDFQWDEAVPIIASVAGRVTKINHGSSSGIDVTVSTGVYEVRFKELDQSSLAVKASSKVGVGDRIGLPGGSTGGDGHTHYQLHWEAGVGLLVARPVLPGYLL